MKIQDVQELIKAVEDPSFLVRVLIVFLLLCPGYMFVLLFYTQTFLTLDIFKLTVFAGMYACIFTAPIAYFFFRALKKLFHGSELHKKGIDLLEKIIRQRDEIKATLDSLLKKEKDGTLSERGVKSLSKYRRLVSEAEASEVEVRQLIESRFEVVGLMNSAIVIAALSVAVTTFFVIFWAYSAGSQDALGFLIRMCGFTLGTIVVAIPTFSYAVKKGLN